MVVSNTPNLAKINTATDEQHVEQVIKRTSQQQSIYYQLKREAEDRKRRHGLVLNLAQEMTLR